MYKVRTDAVVTMTGSLLSPGSMKKYGISKISCHLGYRQAIFPMLQRSPSHQMQTAVKNCVKSVVFNSSLREIFMK
jgi:hypothetical protein